MALLNADLTNIDPSASFEPIPAGWYTAQITDSAMHDTRNRDGEYLKLEFTLLDAADKKLIGRKVWSNLNLKNPNPKAVEIAYADLSAIGHAIGVLRVNDSVELHGKPLMIDVRVRDDETGRYAPQNEIKGYRPVDGGIGQMQATGTLGAPAQQATPAAQTQSAPWNRK